MSRGCQKSSTKLIRQIHLEPASLLRPEKQGIQIWNMSNNLHNISHQNFCVEPAMLKDPRDRSTNATTKTKLLPVKSRPLLTLPNIFKSCKTFWPRLSCWMKYCKFKRINRTVGRHLMASPNSISSFNRMIMEEAWDTDAEPKLQTTIHYYASHQFFPTQVSHLSFHKPRLQLHRVCFYSPVLGWRFLTRTLSKSHINRNFLKIHRSSFLEQFINDYIAVTYCNSLMSLISGSILPKVNPCSNLGGGERKTNLDVPNRREINVCAA